MPLIGRHVVLSPLTVSDASADYLSWLNDADVLRYRDAPRSMDWHGMVAWLESCPPDSLRFAIRADGRHIGNASLDGIRGDTADLAIMLGAKDVWGRGYGLDAVDTLARHGFSLGLRRITAGSRNPAFNAIVRRLGWRCVSGEGDVSRWLCDEVTVGHDLPLGHGDGRPRKGGLVDNVGRV